MKSKSSLILAILVFVLFAIAVFFRKMRRLKIHDIRSFSFIYTDSKAVPVERCFKLAIKENKYTASLTDASSAEGDLLSVDVDKDFVKRLEEMLNRNKVFTWDRYEKTSNAGADTYKFSIEVYDENGSSVSARGNGKAPRHFTAVKNDLEVLFAEIIDKGQNNV